MNITLPKRSKGRQPAAALVEYEVWLQAFCAAIQQMDSNLDFTVSSRGWCYILESHGLLKGDFDAAQRLINECRKSGDLPIHIAADDKSRAPDGVDRDIDRGIDPKSYAQLIIEDIWNQPDHYTPRDFWDDQDVYIEMLVEKVDLKSLFSPICRQFYIPIANAKGWSDINSRARMMRRFADHEADGRQCVLLYCGDHDPGGLNISDTLRKNFEDLEDAVGWSPQNLIVDRFGLNYDFIRSNNLTWIDNLETGSGKRLDDPRNKEHHKPYVQRYLAQFGARKVEANALVVVPESGRQMCRDAIANYLPLETRDHYDQWLESLRQEVRQALPGAINELL